MEADSTSYLTNNINAPEEDVDKYNTKLVHDLQRKIELLEREKAELTLENVKVQIRQNIEKQNNVQEDVRENHDQVTRKKIVTIKHLQQDIASMAEELETLKRLVAAKENRIFLLEEEKRLLAYQMEKMTFALKQELQMKDIALCEAHMQTQQLHKRECEAQLELSQCKVQLSNYDSQRQLVMKLSSEKDQALMLVGVWQDKCKAQESRAERLQARLNVLAAVHTDEDE